MPRLTVEYLDVNSPLYGSYSILKLKGMEAKDLRKNPELADVLQENFGERFVVVQETAAGERDYYLNENIVGIPTPEFERQILEAGWKDREIEVPEK